VQDELQGLLRDWLPHQRWFAGKGRELGDVAIAQLTELDEQEAARVLHTLVTVDYADPNGPAQDMYQVLLSIRREAADGYHGYLLGDCSEGLVYDGLHDPAGSAVLLRGLQEGRTVGELRMVATIDLEELSGLAVGVEQSNTSIIYGDAYILKVFRRLAAGVNPDLELTRALAEAGSSHVAAVLGWIEGDLPGTDSSTNSANAAGAGSTFALLQTFLRGGTEGWKLAVASVRDLYAELDLHPDEVGGDFAAESERLGAATAEVHALLARVLESRMATAQESQEAVQQMHERLDAALAIVSDLQPYEAALRSAYDEVQQLEQPVPIQRIHGDFHLGQVLRTETGWVLLDFEGEPARPLAERRALMSPLRDIAGMLRSYDYAARSLLMDRPHSSSLNVRAEEWSDRNRAAFCEGYTAGGGADPRESSVLLRAFELDKAVYEVVYEARHRPTWLAIPLGAVARLAG
jgi:maltokinase